MNRKILTLALTLILLLVFAAPALAQEPDSKGDQVVFGDNYVLGAEQTHNGNLAVLGGSATLEVDSELDGDLAVFGGSFSAKKGTEIDGDVIVFGGNVNIDGKINGDLAAIGGNVNLSDTAVVDGDIGLIGGQVNKAEGATVSGDVQGLTKFHNDFGSDNDDEDSFSSDTLPKPPVPPASPEFNSPFNHDRDGIFSWIGAILADIFWTIALLVVLGVITWLVAAFMPEQMYNVRETLTTSAPLSFGVGLLTSIVAAVLIPVAALLVITICLAIVPMVTYIALGTATLFGWIVIGHILGERLLAAGGRPQPGLIMSSVVGVSILTLLTNMPVIGLIACIGFIGKAIGALIAMAGLGAVLLTRFGTRPYPVQAQPSAPRSGGPSGTPYYPGARTRWTGPEPVVSEEDKPASEEELRAKIREALSQADEVAAAKAKAEEMYGPKAEAETKAKKAALDEAPDETEPEPDKPEDVS
ncbi:MAG: polymer-forming cytoskeletal protein [Anaerolineaceae bacterium]|nr:polymer-forming cytoskeletal protein [Anaerolineaceae bacterium]